MSIDAFPYHFPIDKSASNRDSEMDLRGFQIQEESNRSMYYT